MIFELGSELPVFKVPEVDSEKMKTMSALMSDPNPIHWDVEAVRGLGMGDRAVNQGPNNMAYVINALAEWFGGPDCFRRLRVRFNGNVFAGDLLEVHGEISQIKDEEAEIDIRLTRSENEEVVLSGTASVFIGELS